MSEIPTTIEYGASYTGDEPERWSTVREVIEIEIADVRANLIAGIYETADYEPIVLMRRTRTRRDDLLTPWHPVLVLDELAPIGPLHGPQLATADDVIAGRARYADTPGGHADLRAFQQERSS